MDYTNRQVKAAKKLLKDAVIKDCKSLGYVYGHGEEFNITIEIYLDEIALFVGNKNEFDLYVADLMKEEFDRRLDIITNYSKDLIPEHPLNWLKEKIMENLCHDNPMIKDELDFYHGVEWLFSDKKAYCVDGVYLVLDHEHQLYFYEDDFDAELEIQDFSGGIEKFKEIMRKS